MRTCGVRLKARQPHWQRRSKCRREPAPPVESAPVEALWKIVSIPPTVFFLAHDDRHIWGGSVSTRTIPRLLSAGYLALPGLVHSSTISKLTPMEMVSGVQ